MATGKLFTLSSLFNRSKTPPKGKSQDQKSGKNEDLPTLKKEDIDAVKDAFDFIIELHKENNPDAEKSMIEQYESHLKTINSELSMKMKNGLPPHIINTYINNAKFNLFEICMKKFLEYLSIIDPRLLNILGRINDAHTSIVKNLISN